MTLYSIHLKCWWASVFSLAGLSCSDINYCLLYFYAVMLMGTLVYGIRYTIPEYICTFLVAGGVSTFALLKVNNIILLVWGR